MRLAICKSLGSKLEIESKSEEVEFISLSISSDVELYMHVASVEGNKSF